VTALPAAILAGGLGTRLKPFTVDMPKALVPVLGEPFVFHQLRLLRKRGIERVVMLVGQHGERVVETVGDGDNFDISVTYVFDGPTLLGTGGAIANARAALGEAFFILYGDSYLECDYQAVENTFQASGKDGLMTVFHNTGRWDTSNVHFEAGRILEYSKTDRAADMSHIDYGLGCFRAGAFDGIPTDRPTDLMTVQQRLLRTDNLGAFEVHERFYEVGSLDGIGNLEVHLSSAQA
jgi:MurNAc alpha-1-phosphate uridylyltransferase